MQKKTILIADDEEAIREVLAFRLETNGYQILEASDGCEAQAILTRNEVAAIITDMRMPNCDGRQLLESVRKKSPHSPPVIIVSGYSDMPPSDAFSSGAQGYFSKPINMKSLLSCILRNVSDRYESWKTFTAQGQLFTKIEQLDHHAVALGTGGVLIQGQFGQCKPLDLVKYSFKIHDDGEEILVDGLGVLQWIKSDCVGIEILSMQEPLVEVYKKLVDIENSVCFIPSQL